MSDLLNKRGTFSIDLGVAFSRISAGQPLVPKGTEVFRGMTRIQGGKMHYVGCHADFVEIPDAAPVPEYQLEFNGNEVYFL